MSKIFNAFKKRTAVLLILLLVISTSIPVQAEEAVEITVTTGTQETEKDKKEEKREKLLEDDINADDEADAEENAPITEWEDIQINSTADLVALSRNCWLDTWSRNKRVFLTCDLNVTNSEFVSIPTFGGYFDGQGHTIEGIHIDDTVSYTGLFCYTQETAVISNLTVKGNIRPSGKQVVVGGIVGDNSGTIQNCTFSGIVEGTDYSGGITGFNELAGNIVNCICEGQVLGSHFTGGIAGENMGNIMKCINLAEINTTNVDKGMSLEDINLEQYKSALLNLDDTTKSDKTQDANGTVDTGGVAGLSIGVIQYCSNRGKVGYEHVGYNVGGIAGRQSGYLYSCINEAEILGRKDVGGITGQAEPYVVVDFSQDIVYQLSENINKLHDLISQTIHDAGSESDTISSRLSVIQSFTDKALDDTSYLSDKTVEWTDGVVGAANEAVSRADYIMEEAAKGGGAIDQSRSAAGNVKNAASDLVKVVNDLDIYQYMTQEERTRYDNSKKNLENATAEYNRYVSTAKTAYQNYYLDKVRSTNSPYNDGSLSVNELNMKPVVFGNTVNTWSWSDSNTYRNYLDPSVDKWVHYDDTQSPAVETAFPQSAGDQGTMDRQLIADRDTQIVSNSGTIDTDSISYADGKYYDNHHSSYSTDVANNVDTMAGIVLAHTSQMSESTKNDAQNAVNYAKDAAGNLETAGSQVKSIVSTVNGKSDIVLPQLGTEYRAKTSSLVSNLQGMSDNMGYLNGEMASASDVLLADIEAVNDQFNVIMLLYTDAIDGALDMDYSNVYEDNSQEVAMECTDATIAECTNIGEVLGNLDVSGIAGTMAIEYDFDLEGDVTGIEDAKANSTYQTKCVLRHNINQGMIQSQKSDVGGVCGLQEMGTILLCENYGWIESTDGDYIGGITGQSLSTIQQSYAKCRLSGRKNIGGITGFGTDINDCCAMIRVEEADAFAGAIAGEIGEESKIHHNVFVGGELAGIDRISYSGKAEPITYQELLQMTEIPSAFRQLTVSFYIDDREVKKINCNYMEMLSSKEYPDVPKKDGYYAQWDIKELSRIVFDEDVTAEYKRYLTTLAGSQVRENSQSDFLVDGKFEEEDELHSTLYSTTDIPLKNVLEHWKLEIPNDNASEHQLRYLSPKNGQIDVEIYINQNNKWKKADTDKMGNYRTFMAEGSYVEIAIVSVQHTWKEYIWYIAGAAVAGAAILFAIIYFRRKNINKKRTEERDTLEEIEV